MIGIIVGSDSDLETMNNCVDKLDELNIDNEIVTASAHRNPEKVTEYIKKWEATGYKIIIAAAGMSAALPGVVASQTKLPEQSSFSSAYVQSLLNSIGVFKFSPSNEFGDVYKYISSIKFSL